MKFISDPFYDKKVVTINEMENETVVLPYKNVSFYPKYFPNRKEAEEWVKKAKYTVITLLGDGEE